MVMQRFILNRISKKIRRNFELKYNWNGHHIKKSLPK
jgi:hypothetical protein